jgi:para-aminobenzoate synthetase/4-amino-4-deoxychorismate lyase
VLAADGEIEVETAPLTRQGLPAPLPFVFAATPVDAANPYLRHKTTRRGPFDEALARAAAHGAKEALFENQYGELTEGAWTNLFVDRSGELVTPPLSAGLLPGTLRAELLATGRAREASLTRADLAAADAIYLGNSVRGLMKARLLEDETGAAAPAAQTSG